MINFYRLCFCYTLFLEINFRVYFYVKFMLFNLDIVNEPPEIKLRYHSNFLRQSLCVCVFVEECLLILIYAFYIFLDCPLWVILFFNKMFELIFMNVQWLFYGNFIALINRWEKNHVDKVNNVKEWKKNFNTQLLLRFCIFKFML